VSRWVSGFRFQVSARGRRRGELRKHEKFAQLQAGDDGAATEVGEVGFVRMSDALDEAVDT
jgi:hypothetical protein